MGSLGSVIRGRHRTHRGVGSLTTETKANAILHRLVNHRTEWGCAIRQEPMQLLQQGQIEPPQAFPTRLLEQFRLTDPSTRLTRLGQGHRHPKTSAQAQAVICTDVQHQNGRELHRGGQAVLDHRRTATDPAPRPTSTCAACPVTHLAKLWDQGVTLLGSEE